MEQIRSQAIPADTVRLRRLGEMITFVAELPMDGSHVLTGDRRARVELLDTILQHRGTAVAAVTKVHVCTSADDERMAVAGVSGPIFAAPGYKALWARTFTAEPKPQVVTADIRLDGAKISKALKALVRGAAPERAEVPGALRHSWTAPIDNPPTGRPPAWSEGQPQTAVARPIPGPWQKPEFKARRPLDVVLTCSDIPVEGGRISYQLRWDAPKGWGGGRTGFFQTPEARDAALPGFAAEARATLAMIAAHNDTAPLAA